MSKQPNRLKPGSEHHFSGTDIDRSRPLRFRLNGRSVNGFFGDTVLSAAIASGINEAGRHLGSPLALSERFAPPVLPSSQLHLPQNALPMARLPAIDGMELSTLGTMRAAPAPRRIADIVRTLAIGPNRSLGVHFDGASLLAGPWIDQPTDSNLETDMVVVGAGIAGLSAAMAAAEAGEGVLLVERRATPGGDAKLFGAVEDEEPPDQVIKRLLENLGKMPNVTLLASTEAFAIARRTLRAHTIEIVDGAPVGRVLAIAFKRLVLANGVLERLPVFPGNRLPGVMGVLEAYHRGVRHGVWQGKSALFNTAVSVAYRLAMLASDAGISIEKLADMRTQPQSRFIEFSKAYGIKLARGLAPDSAAPAPSRQAGVLVHLAPTFEGVAQQAPALWTELLVTSGGWQPDLGLWLMAGGQSRWDAPTGRLEAAGALDGIALAGSLAGYRNASACARSGEAAVAGLLGRSVAEIDDRQVDPMYETADAVSAIAKEHVGGVAYLDGGASLALRRAVTKVARRPFLPRRQPEGSPLADQARTLSISDVAATVQVGIIPEGEAATVAQERCLVAGDIVALGRLSAPLEATAAAQPGAVPAYLAGRFGEAPEVWRVVAEQTRAFDPGCLLYINSELSDPLAAVGVVIGATAESQPRALVLLGKAQATSDNRLFIRDISGAAPVKLIERFSPAPPTPEAETPEPVPTVEAPEPAEVVEVDLPAPEQPAGGPAMRAAEEGAPTG